MSQSGKKSKNTNSNYSLKKADVVTINDNKLHVAFIYPSNAVCDRGVFAMPIGQFDADGKRIYDSIPEHVDVTDANYNGYKVDLSSVKDGLIFTQTRQKLHELLSKEQIEKYYLQSIGLKKDQVSIKMESFAGRMNRVYEYEIDGTKHLTWIYFTPPNPDDRMGNSVYVGNFQCPLNDFNSLRPYMLEVIQSVTIN